MVVPGECSVFIVVASPALFTLRSLSRVTFRVSPADARSVGPTAMRSVIAEEEGLYPRVLYENAVPDTAVVKLTVYCSTLMMVAALDAVNSVIACSAAALTTAGAKSARASARRPGRRCMGAIPC